MKCIVCGKSEAARALKVCRECILKGKGKSFIEAAHRSIPKNGRKCTICGNRCGIEEGEEGFCRLRVGGKKGIISYSSKEKAIGEYYHDALPTNCVASWVCGKKEGYNLAVFYGACNFDCLFCQNWIYHEMAAKKTPIMEAKELVRAAERATCICFFGGDPSCQIEHALNVAEKSTATICWETNGNFSPKFLSRIADFTDGIIKFDLKAWNESLHIALCGVSNKNTLRNFEWLASRCNMAASTLLVPYYITPEEVYRIAEFIASIDENIPYSLLAFYPSHKMNDLPFTTKRQAEECYSAAIKAGLKRVSIGNVHLLR